VLVGVLYRLGNTRRRVSPANLVTQTLRSGLGPQAGEILSSHHLRTHRLTKFASPTRLKRNEQMFTNSESFDNETESPKAAHKKVFTEIRNFSFRSLHSPVGPKKAFQKRGASQISESDKPRETYLPWRRAVAEEKSENKLHCYVCRNTINLLCERAGSAPKPGTRL
jgi:hypothetical protein